MQGRDMSLDQPLTKDENSLTMSETLSDEAPNAEDQMISNNIQTKVRERLDTVYEDLSPRERYILENRLMSDSPITLEAAGHEFGVTRERVRQIEERLKGKLRKQISSDFSLAA